MYNSRILIVDDTPENIDVLGNILKDYKKSVALNGKKAIKIANEKSPDLILLDIMMPGMDGFEVCKILKVNPKTKDIPIIFITAKNQVEDETKGLELGAVDFISKPISPPSVLARVKTHLELSRSRNELTTKNSKLQELNNHILESLSYAKLIQKSVLPWESQIDKLFKDYFILFKPQDIVSGDYYWMQQNDKYSWLAVCDCTGHGVPGAMLSMIGSKIMDDCILSEQIYDCDLILEKFDKKFSDSLNKSENANYLRDTIDVCLIRVDKKSKLIQFSGAKRPLLFIKDSELHEVKGSRKAIGDYFKNTNSFESHELDVSEVSYLYLTSDGFPDQNDQFGKKLGSKKFKELLLSHHNKKSLEQKNTLLGELHNFQKQESQRDDITIIGWNPNE
ncbi:response regulator [Candidatus Kapabacteria bacterium]|nr:response regulator [Candidatus Kapabacteria bacterium]